MQSINVLIIMTSFELRKESKLRVLQGNNVWETLWWSPYFKYFDQRYAYFGEKNPRNLKTFVIYCVWKSMLWNGSHTELELPVYFHIHEQRYLDKMKLIKWTYLKEN